MSNDVQISVQHNSKMSLYSKIDVSAAKKAIEQLSGDGFKLWVSLCLNRDGYTAIVPYNKSVAELAEAGYIIQLDAGRYTFSDEVISSESAEPEISEEYKELFSLYGISNHSDMYREAKYINDRLIRLGLADQTESILNFWIDVLPNINRDRYKVKNPIRYDCTIVLTEYIQRNFQFETEDVIDTGKLRYHDDEFELRVFRACADRCKNRVAINDTNINFWQNALRNGKFEIPLPVIEAIIKERQSEKPNP